MARGDLLAAVILLLVMLATRGIWFGDPVADFDEQLYTFIGWRLTQGELPFVDWWDRKPFGLFAIFALAHALMGPEAIAYQIMAALFAMVGAGLVFALARDEVDRFSAAIAGAIYLALMAAYGSYSAQSEIFFAPLMLGMVWLLRDSAHPRFARRALWAMLLGGLALQIKYTVLPQCAVLGLWALWQHRQAGARFDRLVLTALAFAALGLLPTVLVGLFYAAAGELDAFLFANFFSFFTRAAADQGRWISSHAIGVVPLAVLVIGGLGAASLFNPPANRARYRLYLLWALASLASVLLPGTVYLYYYASLVAPAVLVALPLMNRDSRAGMVPGVLLLVLSLMILSLPTRYAQSMAERNAAEQLASAIAPHVGAADNCLFVFDGPTALYRMSGACVPTSYVYPDHLNNALESRALGVAQDWEVARILATMPGAIVTADRPMTTQNAAANAMVRGTIYLGYEEKISVRMHDRILTVWVRRGS